MRINKFVAQASSLSRRAADQAIRAGRVTINGQPAELGDDVDGSQFVRLDEQLLALPAITQTIIFNKPIGYVVSRDGQGSHTIYDLLPPEYQQLQPVGRLDKDSSGLLLLTNDGQLAQELTHPKYQKEKVYEVELDTVLNDVDRAKITHGINLEDGPSSLLLQRLGENDKTWQVTMSEGRSRQIRRTFAALGYEVTKLHRVQFGGYELGELKPGQLLLQAPHR